LERRREFHRGWWFWSRLLIYAPGPLIYFAGDALLPEAAVFLLLIAIAIPLNLRVARRYQDRIDELDRRTLE
jgi:hypothetical protein